jgi:two-component system, NtrC family, response regulator AtoC
VQEKPIEAVSLLVVSREPSVLQPLWSIGESNSWQLETAGNGWEALERIQCGAVPNLLLLELHGDGDGLHVLRWVHRLRPALPIILLCHAKDAVREKEAARLGAQDFLVRPFEEKQLESAIRRHLSQSDDIRADFTSEDVEQLGDDNFFLRASPVMQRLHTQAELLAQANVPVLIVGEPGSGRNTTARLIHKLSVRSGFRFARVNCASLPGELLERELFGSGANRWRTDEPSSAGKFELCHRGTLFFSEIAEMPISLQSKLLLVMQQKHFFKPASNTRVEVDVRILAATATNIEQALSEKKLREDLYYRLSAFTVHVPALRHRKDEIPFLLDHLMHKLSRHYNLPAREFSPQVVDACQQYSWPGNVKELESFVKRYLMIGEDDLTLTGPGVVDGNPARPIPNAFPRFEADEGPSANQSLKFLIHNVKSEAERSAIAAALESTGWNRKAAARLLKVSYRTILSKIEHYHMNSPAPYSSPLANENGTRGGGHRVKATGT